MLSTEDALSGFSREIRNLEDSVEQLERLSKVLPKRARRVLRYRIRLFHRQVQGLRHLYSQLDAQSVQIESINPLEEYRRRRLLSYTELAETLFGSDEKVTTVFCWCKYGTDPTGRRPRKSARELIERKTLGEVTIKSWDYIIPVQEEDKEGEKIV